MILEVIKEVNAMNEFELEQIIKQNRQIERCLNQLVLENADVQSICVDTIGKLRTFVEHIAAYHFGMTKRIETVLSKDNLRTIVKFLKEQTPPLPFLSNLHLYLQASASHYVIDEISAPRLLWKYVPMLLNTKKWFKRAYGVDLLNNLQNANSIHSDYLAEYYKRIYEAILSVYASEEGAKDRYYVYKSVPIVINDDVIYETTIGIASDYSNKFNRFIVFSHLEIDQRYAVKLNFTEKIIEVNGLNIPIKIVSDYVVSIRPCEFNNLGKLIGLDIDVKSNLNEYKSLMDYMTTNHKGLCEIVLAEKSVFNAIKNKALEKVDKTIIFALLEKTRSIILKELYGANVLKYLLVTMNNKLIKDQYSKEPSFDSLNIKKQRFEKLPIAMSLIRHNTSILYLMEAFDLSEREDELYYRRLAYRTNNKGILYHSFEDFGIEKSDAIILIDEINKKLAFDPESTIIVSGDLLFIKEYETYTKDIFTSLSNLEKQKSPGYTTYIQNEMNNTSYNIDSDEKKKMLLSLFKDSSVACIFGSAGTGKSTMAKHISYLIQKPYKRYISNTNPAVMNLYRRVGGSKGDFSTIRSYLRRPARCNILFVDECSTVSNKDFSEILRLGLFNFLVLLGDVYQIESIEFGTWFKFAKKLLKNCSKNELTELHRTSKPELQTLWKSVRAKEKCIEEILSSLGCTKELDDPSLFEKAEDQIILCLSYDGLYGINNLNLIMQNKNQSTGYKLGNATFKVGDPVLFLDNNKYAPVLYNNLKGTITGIQEQEKALWFTLNVESNIGDVDVKEFDGEVKVLKNNLDGTTDICLSVEKEFDSDRDETTSKLVPFQIAYAVSIHKAQGLEYKEVKIVIDEGCDEMISHDVFYTAITRATEKLRIYWTPDTQARVVNNILKDDQASKDISIFASRNGFKMRK